MCRSFEEKFSFTVLDYETLKADSNYCAYKELSSIPYYLGSELILWEKNTIFIFTSIKVGIREFYSHYLKSTSLQTVEFFFFLYFGAVGICRYVSVWPSMFISPLGVGACVVWQHAFTVPFLCPPVKLWLFCICQDWYYSCLLWSVAPTLFLVEVTVP